MRILSIASVLLVGAALTGCNQQTVDHVSFKLGDDLQTANVSVFFSESIQANMYGFFPLKEYGQIYINPSVPGEQLMEIGFQLNTKDIMSDQDYINLELTDTMPNGLPMGLGYSLAEIKSPDAGTSSFDLYGYVDVLHAKWLGAAAMFSSMNEQVFPAGLTITQGFNPDTEGKPSILLSVFGPTLEGNQIVRNGGVLLLANVKNLVTSGRYIPSKAYTYYPKKKKMRVGGPEVLLKD